MTQQSMLHWAPSLRSAPLNIPSQQAKEERDPFQDWEHSLNTQLSRSGLAFLMKFLVLGFILKNFPWFTIPAKWLNIYRTHFNLLYLFVIRILMACERLSQNIGANFLNKVNVPEMIFIWNVDNPLS